MGGKCSQFERESTLRCEYQFSDGDRCFEKGLGRFLSGSPDGRLLKCSGSRIAHDFLRMLAAFSVIRAFINEHQKISILCRQ